MRGASLEPDTSFCSTLASLILSTSASLQRCMLLPKVHRTLSTLPRSPQLMVTGAVAAVAAVQQASSVKQALVEGAGAGKARCCHARLLLLLLEAQLVLTRQGSVQTARRQVHALSAASGGGRRERVPQSAATRRPEETAVAAGRHACRAGRRGLAAAAVRLG